MGGLTLEEKIAKSKHNIDTWFKKAGTYAFNTEELKLKIDKETAKLASYELQGSSPEKVAKTKEQINALVQKIGAYAALEEELKVKIQKETVKLANYQLEKAHPPTFTFRSRFNQTSCGEVLKREGISSPADFEVWASKHSHDTDTFKKVSACVKEMTDMIDTLTKKGIGFDDLMREDGERVVKMTGKGRRTRRHRRHTKKRL